MGENTNIEWADHTWNPWRGCTKVSQGCANCYAETWARRNPAVFGQWGKGAPRVLAKNWGDPVRWNRFATCNCGTLRIDMRMPGVTGCPVCNSLFRRPRVFPSFCDWLDEEVPAAWLAQFLALINLTPNIDWLLLTKRPENWRERIDAAALASTPFHQRWLVEWLNGTPPGNVWFGVSVEDQTRADERIPLLMEIPARLRWLSVEPLIGQVDFRRVPGFNRAGSAGVEMLRNFWVVVGGESGHGARPCRVEWIRTIADACRAAGVPVFVKQLGSRPDLAPIQHPKGGDPAEWPHDLAVREFPNSERSGGEERR